MIGKSEVKTKTYVIGKLEIKNRRPNAFHPFTPVQSGYLAGIRATEVPVSTAQGGH